MVSHEEIDRVETTLRKADTTLRSVNIARPHRAGATLATTFRNRIRFLQQTGIHSGAFDQLAFCRATAAAQDPDMLNGVRRSLILLSRSLFGCGQAMALA